MTYGNPKFAYSYFDTFGSFLNKNGVFVGTDLVGVAGHSASSGSIVDTSQRQPDGTFGPLGSLWSSPNNRYSGGTVATVFGLNDRNQVLGISGPAGLGPNVFLLDDLNTKTLTDLKQLLPPAWHLDSAGSLDNLGRLLVNADLGPSTGDYRDVHTLLLTPAGVSSDPMTVPEPSSLAVLATALGAVALGGRLRSR
jgi:hypothetical protein